MQKILDQVTTTELMVARQPEREPGLKALARPLRGAGAAGEVAPGGRRRPDGGYCACDAVGYTAQVLPMRTVPPR